MSLLTEANQILVALELPRPQQNDRSAYCLLALLGLKPGLAWRDAAAPLIGITPIMDWTKAHFGQDYAPNTRETFRRQTMHQFVEAGIALYNPDKPSRKVNSPKAVYQISPEAISLLRTFGAPTWSKALSDFKATQGTLAAKYAMPRQMEQVPLKLKPGLEIRLSPGDHSQLIADIITEFAPRFVPGAELIYAGDTGEKFAFFDRQRLLELGIAPDEHGKMPDVVLYDTQRKWLVLVEAVTSHGPVDGKRHAELSTLFAPQRDALVLVTAFPTRQLMTKYVPEISWETEVWVSNAPSHLIHFNGSRFLGPYATTKPEGTDVPEQQT